jgi:hypothetical protein
MNTNILPHGIDDLRHLATQLHAGLAALGPWIGIRQVTAPGLIAQRHAFDRAEEEFSSARTARAAASRAVGMADEALTAWLAKARLVVMLALGSQWSPAWSDTGFRARGTNVPKRMEPRAALADALATYFEKHPELEVVLAEVTAARGAALLQALRTAQVGLQTATEHAAQAKAARDRAERTLRRTMRLTITVLASVIGKSDPRWTRFGLNIPRPTDTPRRTLAHHPPPPPLIELPAPRIYVAPQPRTAAA